MVKVALGLLAIGIAAMPFVDNGAEFEKVAVAYHHRAGEGVVDPNQTIYSVRSQTGAECRLTRSSKRNEQHHIKADSACADVYTGLDRVTDWTAGDNGQVNLKDATGKIILRIEASDAFAYEALTADGALITFAFSDV